ncbi:hypothetical protein BpHYR1_039964, partial [Brachionus plicatilis]
MDTVKEKIFCDEYDISGEGWSLAYSFLTVNDRVIKKGPNSTTFLLTKKEFKDELNMDYAKGLFIVAVVEKLVEIPNKYKKCSIEPKAKRGRKANAAKAL